MLSIATVTDSQAADDPIVCATRASHLYPYLIANALTRYGVPAFVRTFGVSGDAAGLPLTTLTTGLASSGETTIVVGSAAGVAQSGTLLIDSEVFAWTYSGSGLSLAITGRKESGTAEAAHTAGAAVRFLTMFNSTAAATFNLRTACTRIQQAFVVETPRILILELGTNDASYGMQGTYQANLQALIKASKFRVQGVTSSPFNIGGTIIAQADIRVATQLVLPANGRPGDRLVVMVDSSKTGGIAATNVSDMTTITGDFSSSSHQTVWENRNPQGGERGWGRVAVDAGAPGGVATPPTAVPLTVVQTTHYRDWSNAQPYRDRPSEPFTAPAGQGSNSTINAAVAAAVTAENVTIGGGATARPCVAMVDVYNFMRDRIVAGTDPDFSTGSSFNEETSFQQNDGNNHFNDYGNWVDMLAHFDPVRGIPTAFPGSTGAEKLANFLTAVKAL